MFRNLINEQREYFNNDNTKRYSFRLEMLKRLKTKILENEEKIAAALYKDLNKSYEESYMTEIGMTLKELNYQIKHLKKHMKLIKKKTPLALFPAKSYLKPEPLGNVLIISPWNYPFLLTINPLIGAIAAGNTAILKPSEYSVNTSNIIKEMINEIYEEKFVEVILGEVNETTNLLKQKFDYIFFTGSTNIGRIILKSAADNLTKVTLELGGKSPSVIYDDYDLKLATKRIVFGKLINAGQTCIAPDYLFLNEKSLDKFIEYFNYYVKEFYNDPLENDNYPKIISDRHFERVINLLQNEEIIVGGKTKKRKIEPTLVRVKNFETNLMKEEIFGPILPIITYNENDEIYDYLKKQNKPLATYVFTNNKDLIKKHTDSFSSGGIVFNDTLMHFVNENLGFGGVGQSGMGKYHGKLTFETFSHYKSLVIRGKIDLNIRYHPYNKKKMKIYKTVNK